MDICGGLDADLDGGGDIAGLGLDGGDYGGLDFADVGSLVFGHDGGVVGDFGDSNGAGSFDSGGSDAATVANATVHNLPWKKSVSGDKRAFIVHVHNHGYVDMRKEVEQIARSLGLCRVKARLVSGDDNERFEPKLLSLSAWSRSSPVGAMPRGYFAGATGSTTIWRQYFQLGKRNWPWSAPTFDKCAHVHIEVSCMSWFYRETGDHETKILVRVVPTLYMCPVSGETGYRRQPLQKHVQVGERFSRRIFENLKAALPHKASLLLRGNLVGAGLKLPTPADLSSTVTEKPAVSVSDTSRESGRQRRIRSVELSSNPFADALGGLGVIPSALPVLAAVSGQEPAGGADLLSALSGLSLVEECSSPAPANDGSDDETKVTIRLPVRVND